MAPGIFLAKLLKSISHRQTVTLNRLERLEKMVEASDLAEAEHGD